MTIKELRVTMMKTKKSAPEKSKVYLSLLSATLLLAKEDGNREPTEKDIVSAAKKEMKMAQQSKDSGAPYNEYTFEVCEEFLPKMLSREETENIIKVIISKSKEVNIKMMGKLMGSISKHEKGEFIDKKIASQILKDLLS